MREGGGADILRLGSPGRVAEFLKSLGSPVPLSSELGAKASENSTDLPSGGSGLTPGGWGRPQHLYRSTDRPPSIHTSSIYSPDTNRQAERIP